MHSNNVGGNPRFSTVVANNALRVALAAPVLSLLLVNAAHAVPVDFDTTIGVWIETTGANSLGRSEGDTIQIIVREVEPKFTASVTATQGGTAIELEPLLATRSGGVFDFREHFGRVVLSDEVRGSWDIHATNLADPSAPTTSATTQGTTGFDPLGLPTAIVVDSTNALTPTVTWTNADVNTTANQIRVIDNRTNLRVANFICGDASSSCGRELFESFQMPEGLLAPTGEYTFRVMGLNQPEPFDISTRQARSNAFIDYTVSAGTVRQAGSVGVFDSPGSTTATGENINIGTNTFADKAVSIGFGSSSSTTPGAVTIDSGSSLTASFMNVGQSGGQFGTLLIDGGSVNLYGTDTFDSANPNGGFMQVGRFGTGFVRIDNGGSVTLNADNAGATDSFVRPGLNVGLNRRGTLVLDDASTITVNGWDGATLRSEYGLIGVGRSGVGRMDIRGGSVVTNDSRGLTLVGQSITGPSGKGAVNVEGTNSRLNAGAELRIGDRTGNGGEGYVGVRDGGTVSADIVNIYSGGLLTGDGGTAIGNVNVFEGGVLKPGDSPGTMTIVGNLIVDGGVIALEAFSAGALDQIIVTGDALFGAGALEILLGFDPGDVLSLFDIQGTTTLLDSFAGVEIKALPGSDAPIGNDIFVNLTGDLNDQPIGILAEVQSTVPAPSTLLLLLVGYFARHLKSLSQLRAPMLDRIS